MVQEYTTYICEICGGEYSEREEAEHCEATVLPPKPVHLIGRLVYAKYYHRTHKIESIKIVPFTVMKRHTWALQPEDGIFKDGDHYGEGVYDIGWIEWEPDCDWLEVIDEPQTDLKVGKE